MNDDEKPRPRPLRSLLSILPLLAIASIGDEVAPRPSPERRREYHACAEPIAFTQGSYTISLRGSESDQPTIDAARSKRERKAERRRRDAERREAGKRR